MQIFLERNYNIFTKRNISFQSLCVSPIYVITNKPDLTKYHWLNQPKLH